MAELRVKGDFVGPGERKTAERLRDELPKSWVIFAGRKLPGETRDDVDLIVVGEAMVFVLEEKSWGPVIVVDDNNWYVKEQARGNPLNRNAQLARKVAGLLRDKAKDYKDLKGKRVAAGVILSHDNVQVLAGKNHSPDENIWHLSEASARLLALDAEPRDRLGIARRSVLAYLDDMPLSVGRPEIGSYSIVGRLDVPGLEQAYLAKASDDSEVILKCYPMHQLKELGDPSTFLERETRAINKLADLARTWRALPFFESDALDLFVVPVIPPSEGRTLEASIRKPGPERPDGKLDEHIARDVVVDAFEALSELHEYGLVHRALHPRRVWLGRRMRVMFSDLHLARIEGDASVALWAPDSDISEDYRAPECAATVGLATPLSDVYSLALCMLEWLFGESVLELRPKEISERLGREFPWATPLTSALQGDAKKRPDAATLAAQLTSGESQPPVDNEPTEFREGATIAGRYLIKHKLGRGGFATSWLVYDNQAAQSKVLKEFRHGVPDELRAEYKAADSLRNERCGAVYDVQVDHEPQYLVSEYVKGESLAERGVSRTVDELRTIAVYILQALEYIHGKDLVHGDVTPDNVIVATDGSSEAKLIDFGLSVPMGARPAGWHPRFGAPEVIAGQPASQMSDIFGFAATMVHAMLGRLVGRADDGIYEVVDLTDVEMDTWGPEGTALLRVFFRAAAATPEQRPQSVRELLELVTSARPEPTSPRAEDEHFEAKINANVTAIRRLYRASSGGNAGNRGLDDEFAKQTYVDTMLDTQLLPRVLAGDLDVVLLSGNPGDGKTSVLVKLAEALRARGAVEEHLDEAGWRLRLGGRLFLAVYDASESHGELSSDQLVRQALDPVVDQSSGPATALVAVNDGRLLQFFTDHEDDFEEWKFSIDDQLDGKDPGDSRLAVVDLKRRSLAAFPGEEGLASRALAELVREGLWDACKSCSARQHCPILANRNLLAGSGADAFGELILVSHLRRRRRATFRDVRSAAAWLLTGDRDCEDIHQLGIEGRSARYLGDASAHDLAFSETSNDYLINEWSDLDPGVVAAPLVDELRRQHARNHGNTASHYGSVSSVARALYFGDLTADLTGPEDVRAYRYLDEFVDMLKGIDPITTRARLLLGVSRLAGAFGYQDSGLAMSSGMPGSTWAVLHTIPTEQFTAVSHTGDQPYVETIPDQLTLEHRAGPKLNLTLDTAEIILRAADGELIDDPGSDSIRQEIDSFVSQLARQPSGAVRLVDASGSVAIATRQEQAITLERS